jgi:hypothetical protein
MKAISALPDSERPAAIILTIVGLVIILTTPFLTTPFDFNGMGISLKFDTNLIYKTPIFWIGTTFWLFWISRIFRFGECRYAFIGWSLCAGWYAILGISIICSGIGILFLSFNLVGSVLSLIVFFVSLKVFVDFMALREAHKAANRKS